MKNIIYCFICGLSLVLSSTLTAQVQIEQSIEDPNITVALTCGESFVFLAENNGRYAVLDTNRRQCSPYKYSEIDLLHNSMMKARVDGRKALINCEGKQITGDDIVDYKVFYGDELKDKYFVINAAGKMGVIDNHGTILVPVVYDRIDPVSAHKYLYAQSGDDNHYYRYNGERIRESKLTSFTENQHMN